MDEKENFSSIWVNDNYRRFAQSIHLHSLPLNHLKGLAIDIKRLYIDKDFLKDEFDEELHNAINFCHTTVEHYQKEFEDEMVLNEAMTEMLKERGKEN